MPDDPHHRLELRIQKLESRITYGVAAVVAVAAVFGLTGIKTFMDARTALTAEIESISDGEIATSITELHDEIRTTISETREGIATQAAEAQTHLDTIRSVRASLCADPASIERYGFCLFHVRDPGGHYSLNYGAAAATCTAQGARLCTLAEVSEAHRKGLDRCAYGWVADLAQGGRASGDPTYGQTGTVVLPIANDCGRPGCTAGLSRSPGQNIMTENANAFCCL